MDPKWRVASQQSWPFSSDWNDDDDDPIDFLFCPQKVFGNFPLSLSLSFQSFRVFLKFQIVPAPDQLAAWPSCQLDNNNNNTTGGIQSQSVSHLFDFLLKKKCLFPILHHIFVYMKSEFALMTLEWMALGCWLIRETRVVCGDSVLARRVCVTCVLRVCVFGMMCGRLVTTKERDGWMWK